VAKEKLGEILLIAVKIEDNNGLLTRFSPKSSGIYTIFVRHTNTFTVCLANTIDCR
jgi:hypothetical protein